MFLAALSTGLGLLALDWAASYLAYPEPRIASRPSEHYFEFHPLRMWRLKPGFRDERVAISEDGFRGASPLSPSAPNQRVFLIGGSSVFGLGVREDETVSFYLEDYLSAGGAAVEVVNAGVTGYYSTQELLLVQQELLGFSPSRIVALTGRNDVFYSLHPGYRPDEVPYHGLLREALGALDPYYAPAEAEPSFHLLRLMGRGWRAVRPAWDAAFHSEGLRADARAVPVFLENQRKLQTLLAGLGVRYDLFLQPILGLPERPLAPGEESHAPYLPALRDGYGSLADAAGALPSDWAHGLVALPASPAPLFLDDCHLTPLGARLTARVLGERLVGVRAANFIDLASGRGVVFLDEGWHPQEPGFRWTEPLAAARLRVPANASRFRLVGNAGAVAGRLVVALDGRPLLEHTLERDAPFDLAADVPREVLGRDVVVTLEAPGWSPTSAGRGDDARTLGVLVRSFGFDASGAAVDAAAPRP